MTGFFTDQKWRSMNDGLYGEVTEISDGGRKAVIIITDQQGKKVDVFNGSWAEFILPNNWRLIS